MRASDTTRKRFSIQHKVSKVLRMVYSWCLGQLQKRGMKKMAKRIEVSEKDKARFWHRVNASTPDQCWEWIGSKAAGYGLINIGGSNFRVSRVAYFLFNGTIDDSLDVLHRCDNPACCNPHHLFQGTEADNARDMMSKGRQNFQRHPESRPRGERHGAHTHPERMARGERHGMAKLSAEDVSKIRELRKRGVLLRVIAKMFGITESTGSRIATGQGWK